MFDFPPTGGDEGSGDVVRDLVGNRNYRRRPRRGEGSDAQARVYAELRIDGPIRRMIQRIRKVIS